MNDTFENYIAAERTRIHGEREKLVESRREIDAKIAALDTELSAIIAYEEVKSGRAAAPRRAVADAGAGGVRRTGQRTAVLAEIEGSLGGLTASEIVKRMDAVTGSDKTSIRNALSALKRNGLVELKDGRNRAVS